jgi:hypothetical protein
MQRCRVLISKHYKKPDCLQLPSIPFTHKVTKMNVCRLTLIFLTLFNTVYAREKTEPVSCLQGNYLFEWNPDQDLASLQFTPDHSTIWQGSLLPAFWLKAGGKMQYVKARVTGSSVNAEEHSFIIQIGPYGTGKLVLSIADWGIRFKELDVEWKGEIPAIKALYFGTAPVSLSGEGVWPSWDRPFMPDWQSFGFCVPGAKGGIAQSYFRMWDFGQANIALGNYGPSMGSPYGAAYPRPLFFAGMGSAMGFIALGAGSVPDGAMSLCVQSTHGCIEYRYEEEVWGALKESKRQWLDPLRISFAENAWSAFRKYYHSFPPKTILHPTAPVSVWNTWGVWKDKNYIIAPIADFAKQLGANVLVLDDGWESGQGTGQINTKRFPQLLKDITGIHDRQLQLGLWETLGWIDDTLVAGLSSADLLLNRAGRPAKANWNFNPAAHGYYCLDISSPKVREFLKQRTIKMMQTLKPALLKLDFGYGMPSPSMAVPRNPDYRGERQSLEMLRIIAEAAKSVDPSVTIMYYGISPLALANADLVSLDDQGDLWYDVPQGHQEWSLWASLLSDQNIAINGSSGYDWESDDEVILNTCIIGAPGSVLAIKNNQPVNSKYLNRRLAINQWFRKTTRWNPVWLNSRLGDFVAPPALNCWGRMEKNGSDSVLSALVLRPINNQESRLDKLPGFRWTGRWGLIAQDDKDIFQSQKLAVIPFDTGSIFMPYPAKPSAVTRLSMEGESAAGNWIWNNGSLTISLSEDSLSRTAGFLIFR